MEEDVRTRLRQYSGDEPLRLYCDCKGVFFMSMSRSTRVRRLATTAILGAAATVLMFLSFPVPFLIPPFIKMDFSELPALLAAFSMGPLSGVGVCFIKNLINVFSTPAA